MKEKGYTSSHRGRLAAGGKSMVAAVDALGVLAVAGLQIVGLTRAYHDASSPEGLIVG